MALLKGELQVWKAPVVGLASQGKCQGMFDRATRSEWHVLVNGFPTCPRFPSLPSPCGSPRGLGWTFGAAGLWCGCDDWGRLGGVKGSGDCRCEEWHL